MDCSLVKISHSSYRYESLKWFTEDLLVPIEEKGTTWQLPAAFFPRRQQFAWKAANAEWGSDGDKGSILVSKGFFESDEMPLRSLTGVILDNENIIKTILKRVRWLPEDTMSQLASVAKLLNKVQLQVWSSWKQEQTPMQNDRVTLQCNPSSYEIGLAMKRSHLLTYYALHTDDNYSGEDSSSSFSEEIANDESLCAEAPKCFMDEADALSRGAISPYCFGHHEHVWLLHSVDGSLQQLIEWTVVQKLAGLPTPLKWNLKDTMNEIVSALEVLHQSCQVVHADISPTNILFALDDDDSAGENNVPGNGETIIPPQRSVHFLLGDLESLTECTPSKTGASSDFFRGTLFYAPLELITPLCREAAYPSPGTDVWSFGIVFLQAALLLQYSCDHDSMADLWKRKNDIVHIREGGSENSALFPDADRLHPYCRHIRMLFDIHPFRWKHGRPDVMDASSNDVFELMALIDAYQKECEVFQQAFIKSSCATSVDPFYGTRAKLAEILPMEDIASPEQLRWNEDLLNLLAHCLHPDPKLRFSARQLKQSQWFSL